MSYINKTFAEKYKMTEQITERQAELQIIIEKNGGGVNKSVQAAYWILGSVQMHHTR